MFAWIAVNLPTILICLGLVGGRCRHHHQSGAKQEEGQVRLRLRLQGCAMSGSCHKR